MSKQNQLKLKLIQALLAKQPDAKLSGHVKFNEGGYVSFSLDMEEAYETKLGQIVDRCEGDNVYYMLNTVKVLDLIKYVGGSLR